MRRLSARMCQNFASSVRRVMREVQGGQVNLAIPNPMGLLVVFVFMFVLWQKLAHLSSVA